jgi:alkanesulfonate monooxygenase SsuD/methylene tetrahydromethanopterin reductase-like flavin-dependent oxidoreductase (luciferase family)
VRPEGIGSFRHSGEHFSISGQFNVPRGPQGHPVIIQAGDSNEGREFAARAADVIFSRHSKLEEGRAFYKDVKDRLAKYGRRPEELKILPAVTYALGDTEEEAAEHAAEIRRAQVGPQTAIAFLEGIWGRDLSGYDPDGPLPDLEPDLVEGVSKGRAQFRGDRGAIVDQWRALAQSKRLTIRELVIEVTGRQSFIGTPRTVADQIEEFVQTDAADGFIFVPHWAAADHDPGPRHPAVRARRPGLGRRLCDPALPRAGDHDHRSGARCGGGRRQGG